MCGSDMGCRETLQDLCMHRFNSCTLAECFIWLVKEEGLSTCWNGNTEEIEPAEKGKGLLVHVCAS